MRGLFWLVLVAAVAVLVVVLVRMRGAKEVTVPARVVQKRVAEHRPRGRDDDSLPNEYLVVFEMGRRQLELAVNRSAYDQMQPGMNGTLTHKADVFIAFEQVNPRSYL